MKVTLLDRNDRVVRETETSNVEISDDLGFHIDHLEEANQELADDVAAIVVHFPTAE